MKGSAERDKPVVRFRRMPFVDDRGDLGFRALTASVFGMQPLPPWSISGLFDGDRCVAGLQVEILGLTQGDDTVPVAAIRNVAVAVDCRGRGLMGDLLRRELAYVDTRTDTVLLFTETVELYTRLGFEPVAQSAFEGRAPEPMGDGNGTILDAARDADLLARLLATRTRVSCVCALTEDGGLTAHSLASGQWPMVYDAGLDAMVVSEWEEGTLVLVDVIAPSMPSAAQILGMLGVRPARLKTLFPPDRLDWHGIPVPAETGLMMRGVRPEAMREPFGLPPTADF